MWVKDWLCPTHHPPPTHYVTRAQLVCAHKTHSCFQVCFRSAFLWLPMESYLFVFAAACIDLLGFSLPQLTVQPRNLADKDFLVFLIGLVQVILNSEVLSDTWLRWSRYLWDLVKPRTADMRTRKTKICYFSAFWSDFGIGPFQDFWKLIWITRVLSQLLYFWHFRHTAESITKSWCTKISLRVSCDFFPILIFNAKLFFHSFILYAQKIVNWFHYSKLLEIEFNFYSIIFSKCFITPKHLFAASHWSSSNSPGFRNIETLAIFLVFSVVCVKFNMCEWVIFGRLSIECGVKFNMCGRVIWKTIIRKFSCWRVGNPI